MDNQTGRFASNAISLPLAIPMKSSFSSTFPHVFLVTFTLFAGMISTACGADWPAFRGPAGTGVADETDVPLHWSSEENVKWKSPLPGPGDSSPVVSGTRVFLTCATESGKRRGLYCFDRKNGEQLWSQIVEFDGEEPTHETNPYCGSSPAADGRRVVVWHGSAGLHCYDYDGRPLWSRDLGSFRHIWGHGSSPVFYGDRILLNCGPGKRTFITAIDAANGQTIWQTDELGGDDGQDRPGQKPVWVGSWSTPVVTQVDGRDQIIISLPHRVQAYDPDNGQIIWSCGGLGDLVYTSVVVGDGVAAALGGFSGPAIGFKLGGSGDMTEQNRLWRLADKNPQRIGSGVILKGYLYLIDEPGQMECIDMKTGQAAWKGRLGSDKVWASIVSAADRLYVTSQAGATYVVAANPERFELLAKNELGEPSNSTIAISDGQFFLRTSDSLVCVQ